LGNAVPSLLSAEETRFPQFLMLTLSFNTNKDGITVLKQSTDRAIILAIIIRAEFLHFLEAFPSSF